MKKKEELKREKEGWKEKGKEGISREAGKKESKDKKGRKEQRKSKVLKVGNEGFKTITLNSRCNIKYGLESCIAKVYVQQVSQV